MADAEDIFYEHHELLFYYLSICLSDHQVLN